MNVLNLRHNPIKTVRIAFVGLGNRGIKTLIRYLQQENVRITALCDIREESVHSAQQILKEKGHAEATQYIGKEAWKEACQHQDADIIFVCTDWESHAKISAYAMNCKKHVAIEIPAAMTIDDCWLLVDTAEKTKQHCTMLENCCYDPFALNLLNMVRLGIFGEITHTEGAYIHDLRKNYFATNQEGGHHDQWAVKYAINHTGNPYPTHGLGPLCQLLNIHKGDRMVSLVSMSSKQSGLSEYAKDVFGEGSEQHNQKYKMGDVSTTIIKTEKGKTMMIQYNTFTPRPYNRLHTICGSKGFAQKYPEPIIMIEGRGESTIYQGDSIKEITQKYIHPFCKEIEPIAVEKGIENTMNYMMDYRLIHCLRNGLPLDIDVYDAVVWSSIVHLSEISAQKGGTPVDIPDFTRGKWRTNK